MSFPQVLEPICFAARTANLAFTRHSSTLVGHRSYEPAIDRTLILPTNISLRTSTEVRQVYDDWRLRSRIEYGYRFDQEQGLDVEDMRAQSLEAMQRLFILVLVTAQFVFYLIDTWPPQAVLWVRKLGLANDLDGPYLVLRSLKALIQTLVTLSFWAISPFPHQDFISG